MPVPLFDFKAQTNTLAADLRAAFERVLTSGQFINGPEVEALEASLAAYLGNNAAGALGLSSGTDALLVPLMAIGVGPGDEVLLPAFTFFATAGAVARVGATPVFVDIDPVSYNICPKDMAKKYTSRTKAIIPVHLYGQSADMKAIIAFAQEKKLVVIEDVAQAVGGRYEQKQLGTIGDWGAYSFFPTKNLGALGDAGALCAKNPEDFKKAKSLRNHGDVSRYEHLYVGGNFRLDALQAAFLRAKIGLLDGWIAKRRDNACYYFEKLSGLSWLVLPQELSGCYHTYNQFTIRVKGGKRDALKAALTAAGIGCMTYYPIPLQRQKCFAKNYTDCPQADIACAEVLSLPIFPELSRAQQDEVIHAIRAFAG